MSRYHHTSSEVGNILDPSRDSYCKQKNIPVYNRTQQNKEHIKQLEERNAQRRAEQEELENQPRYMLEQFKDAKPRIYEAMEAAKPAVTHEFKRRDAGKAISVINVPKQVLEQSQAPTKAPAPKPAPRESVYAGGADRVRGGTMAAAPSAPSEKKDQVNYFQQNIKNMRKQERAMIQERKDAEAAAAEAAAKPEKLGEVPAYLQKRKQEWADEAEKEALRKQLDEELAKIPPGTRPVGDEERETILVQLKAAYKTEIQRLNSFRVQADNEFQMRARRECEDKIAQLEKTIHEFERPGPLYIASD